MLIFFILKSSTHSKSSFVSMFFHKFSKICNSKVLSTFQIVFSKKYKDLKCHFFHLSTILKKVHKEIIERMQEAISHFPFWSHESE